jgi:uncharacterized protein (DUF433 family)
MESKSMKKNDIIIDRGNGPEIAGTRITVYSVLDWVLEGWHSARIATFFRISSQQVEAAMKYIQDHKLEVISAYAEILERCARGNPPELKARLVKYKGKARRLREKLRRGKLQGAGHGGNSRG